jgi:methionine aminopeptidase
MVELKTSGEIAAMREAGRAVAAVLAAVQENAAAGVTLRSLDALARSVLAEHGATSTFLGYQPGFAPTAFPAVICSSVNDAACTASRTTTGSGTVTCSASTAAPRSRAGRAMRPSRSSSARRAR